MLIWEKKVIFNYIICIYVYIYIFFEKKLSGEVIYINIYIIKLELQKVSSNKRKISRNICHIHYNTSVLILILYIILYFYTYVMVKIFNRFAVCCMFCGKKN